MFTHILYATDGSPHAQKALDYVRELARIHHADVTIVHAHSELTDQHRHTASGVVSRAASDLAGAGIAVTQEISEGDAAKAILRAAATHQCDLIVMGARGLSDLQGLLLGSVSHKIIQHADCPVLVVR